MCRQDGWREGKRIRHIPNMRAKLVLGLADASSEHRQWRCQVYTCNSSCRPEITHTHTDWNAGEAKFAQLLQYCANRQIGQTCRGRATCRRVQLHTVHLVEIFLLIHWPALDFLCWYFPITGIYRQTFFLVVFIRVLFLKRFPPNISTRSLPS